MSRKTSPSMRPYGALQRRLDAPPPHDQARFTAYHNALTLHLGWLHAVTNAIVAPLEAT